jgi:hypothetical protein
MKRINDRRTCTIAKWKRRYTVRTAVYDASVAQHAYAATLENCSMKKVLAVVLAALFLSLAELSSPVISNAVAQSVTIDRDGVRIDRRGRVDRQDAIRIARRNGVDRIRNVDRRGRYWVVTGETRRGRDILRITIDARTGRVLGRRYIHR